MRTKPLGGLLVILLILTASVEASTVSFNPSGTSVGIGDTFTINLIGTGFTDVVDGGGVNLFYNASVLAVNTVTVDTTVWDFIRCARHHRQYQWRCVGNPVRLLLGHHRQLRYRSD